MPETILWEEDLHGGQTWSHILKKNQALRLTDIAGGANVAALLYNARNPTERYNMPDTLKAQHIARLTAGFVLYSDMGRILCSITHDTVGWHDPIGGLMREKEFIEKYGLKTYQEARNNWHQPPQESLVVELGKYGLGTRDLVAPVNLFSKVQADDTGGIRYVPGNSRPDDTVELRAEMDVLLLLHANHHPIEPGNTYAPKSVRLTIKQVDPAADDDPCRLSRPENARGFTLTERYTA
jgi:urea carboxylase-associated protein 2